MAAPKATTSRKRTRKQRNEPSKLVNATQPQVERHQVDIPNPHPTSIVHLNPDDGTSEHPNNVVLGNTEQPDEVQEIFTNYVDSGESYNRKTTIVDIYFATSIV
jgi:hypothetical protein